MNASVSEIIGIFATIVILAGVVYAIGHGGQLSQIITASGNVFTNSIKAATKG